MFFLNMKSANTAVDITITATATFMHFSEISVPGMSLVTHLAVLSLTKSTQSITLGVARGVALTIPFFRRARLARIRIAMASSILNKPTIIFDRVFFVVSLQPELILHFSLASFLRRFTSESLTEPIALPCIFYELDVSLECYRRIFPYEK